MSRTNFCTILTAGYILICIFAMVRQSMCTRSFKLKHKNALIIIHSLAFGGRGMFISTGNHARSNPHKFFDPTLGFPGEGTHRQSKNRWSKEYSNLKIATWNCRSLSNERMRYCESLDYDILALTELWDKAQKFADGTTRWTYGRAKLNSNGDHTYTNDPAAGVGRAWASYYLTGCTKNICHMVPRASVSLGYA